MNSTEKSPVSSTPATAIDTAANVVAPVVKVIAPVKAAAAARKVVRKAAAQPAVNAKESKAAPAGTTPKPSSALKKEATKVIVKKVSPVAATNLTKGDKEVTPKVVLKAKTEKLVKAKKPKLVRDSFTIPKVEFTVFDELKTRAGKLGNSTKKSELIRAGIKALASMTDAAFLLALKAVPAIKTGRPANE